VRVTLERSPAGSLFPVEGSHSTNPTSIACHLFLPSCLRSAPSRQLIEEERKDLLVQDIPSSIFIIFTPLYYFPPNIPNRDPGIIIHFRPFVFRTIIFPITPSGEGIQLGQDSSTSMIIQRQIFGFLDRSNGRGDRADQGDRFGIDGKIVVEGIVE
jgi:hypothetical protein